MDFIAIMLTFVGAYGLFLFMAYVLGKFIFTEIEVNDLDDKATMVKTRTRRHLHRAVR